ncbi:DUF2141 domain-containing protein [Thalassotalea sp. HSM 43]|uniref:DUF2141 domain-containing protein n=1 Tax=Thalassotalea sp. HSM 43 TaxID=2552945 RepID=UPI00107FFB11|nr:DUF2141 domain-containing protein [Thalassotalea sp. HSM 43]QBY04505.1 DUF2141 domain-containing protein [Thalassotalea sp. HSM 43]
MKKITTLLLAGLFAIPASAATLDIEVHGVQSEKGSLVINVYDNKKTWMEEDQQDIFKQHIVPLKGALKDGVLATEIDIPEGEYALHIYQDWDDNKEMDSNWIGIPKEPVATSNNAKGSMGPPSYKDAKFKVDATGAKQVVNIVEI